MTGPQISRLLDFFRDLEAGCPWPKQWNVGFIHLLQKNESSTKVNGFRPITVISLFYRVCAGLQTSGPLLHQIATLADTMLCGFMKGRQAADIWYSVGVCLEVSMHQNVPVHGIVADLVKVYNTLPRHPVSFFLRCLCVPS